MQTTRPAVLARLSALAGRPNGHRITHPYGAEPARAVEGTHVHGTHGMSGAPDRSTAALTAGFRARRGGA